MKHKLISALSIAVVLCLALTAMLAGCAEKKDDTAQTEPVKQEALYTISDGVIIKSVSLEIVGGDTPNLMTVFSNTTDKDVQFDVGQFCVETSDGTKIRLLEGETTLSANTPYIQQAHTSFEDGLNVKVGDTVKIYCGDALLVTTEVTEF